MFTATTTSQNIFDGAAAMPSVGIQRVSEYHVQVPSAASQDVLIFIHGVTGTDPSEAAHWANIGIGHDVTFRQSAGIAVVQAKTATGTSVFNAYPTGAWPV